MDSLQHHGILGQRWGVRRFQNKNGTLTEAGRKRLEQKDVKWAHKNYDKITSKTKKQVSKEMNAYTKELLKESNAYTSKGKLSASTINAYNKKLSELMSEKASSIISPSGKAVRFVAKRGQLGVHMVLADQAYNMDNLKNGIWSSGKVAYKKENVNMA